MITANPEIMLFSTNFPINIYNGIVVVFHLNWSFSKIKPLLIDGDTENN